MKSNWLLVFTLSMITANCFAQQRVRDICRVKGQEQNSLRGVGLVVGLNGTGDPNLQATNRALARMLENSGISIPKDQNGRDLIDELKDVKNVALVFVTATIPPAGAPQGEQLNCTVHAWGTAKSLEGGYLMMTPMVGGLPTSDANRARVYGFAQGVVHLDNIKMPLSGSVHDGCRLESTFKNEYHKDGFIHLILDRDHANFRTAQDIAELINGFPDFLYNESGERSEDIAEAVDQVRVKVKIPEKYAEYPVQFVSQVLSLPLSNLVNQARVVVVERKGTVVIGENVIIAPVAVSHGRFNVEAGPFFPLDPNSQSAGTRQVKLQSLVDALNALKASDQDIIDIIKALKRSGNLYGELVIEK